MRTEEEVERDRLWDEIQNELMNAFAECVEDAFTCGQGNDKDGE